MSRFPSPAHAERIDDRIQQLDDGFERLGDRDTPFTLRKGGTSLERAKQLHSEREASERKRDEESNEPVTRELSEWRADMTALDFPFVDTIPLGEQLNRANQVAEVALEEDFVERITRDVDFRDATVRGKYWHGVQLIEIGTDPGDFPGFREGIVLAHELGHAFYEAWSPDSGIEEQPRLFQSEAEQAQAREISERLHGPFIETGGPFLDYREGSDEELYTRSRFVQDSVGRNGFDMPANAQSVHDSVEWTVTGCIAAAVFASRIVEPMAAQRIAPDAVRRLEAAFGEVSESLF